MRQNGASSDKATNERKPLRIAGGVHDAGLALREALTDQQREFVRLYVKSGGEGTFAAREAGYKNERQIAYGLTRSPVILAAIRQEQARVIGAELASLAIGTLRACMKDDRARWSDKNNAARLALEAAKVIGRSSAPDTKNPHDKPLSEMTASELDAVIQDSARVLQQIQQQARTIEGSLKPLDSEAIPKAAID